MHISARSTLHIKGDVKLASLRLDGSLRYVKMIVWKRRKEKYYILCIYCVHVVGRAPGGFDHGRTSIILALRYIYRVSYPVDARACTVSDREKLRVAGLRATVLRKSTIFVSTPLCCAVGGARMGEHARAQ